MHHQIMESTEVDSEEVPMGDGVPIADLELYCRSGDWQSLEEHLHQDQDHLVDWQRLLNIAYENNHIGIVLGIAAGSVASLQFSLEHACKTGDDKFVNKCLTAEERSSCLGVNWTGLIDVAIANHHEHIAAMLESNNRVSLQCSLEKSCSAGDLECLLDVLTQEQADNLQIDWHRIITIAMSKLRFDIVKEIVRYKSNIMYGKLAFECLQGHVHCVNHYIAQLKDQQAMAVKEEDSACGEMQPCLTAGGSSWKHSLTQWVNWGNLLYCAHKMKFGQQNTGYVDKNMQNDCRFFDPCL